MGDCKDNMKPSAAPSAVKDDKGLGIFKRKKKETAEEKASNFADYIRLSDEKLNALIVKKEVELATEKGREDYNGRALALLKTMSFHLDALIDHAADYSELR